MADENRVQWQVPEYGKADKATVRAWSQRQVEDGKQYWESNPGYEQLEESIRILSGRSDERLAAKQKNGQYSKLQTNRLKRNLREMVNALSDVRFTPGYHSDANEWQGQATLLNRMAASWYIDRFIDRKIKGAVQWMAISPCGWLEIQYRQIPGERGMQEIDCIPHAAFDIVMTGVPESGDHQEAYTVTIIKDVPVFLAHAMWPDDQDKLTPDRESPRGWVEKIKDVFDQVFSEGPQKATAKNPTVRLYYQYVLDLSVNRSGAEMKMGFAKNPQSGVADVETPWSYTVPSVGQMRKNGYDQNGTPTFQPAEVKHCRMFPGRRLIVFTERDSIYDGPSFDWHGKVPVVKLCADQWPFADFSMVHDVAPIHEAVTELERIAHQTARNRFWPTLLYNLKSIAREKAKALRTDISGQRVGYNPEADKEPVKTLLPHNFYTIEEWYQNMVKDLREQEDYQMGVRDISALAKLRIGAAPDSLEKALEAAGPIVKGISRDMERSMRDLAEMYKFYVFQYKTTRHIIQVVGVDGATPENYDWDPGNLIPSHLPGESVDKPSIYTKMERARYIAEHVKFFITPNTMHEIVQTSTKLLYLQLMRGGFPISWWDMAEVMHLPNFGKKPEGTNSMLERFFAQKKMELEFKASLSAEAQALMEQDGGISDATGPAGGQKGTGGRAPSGQAMPRLAQKDGGTRTTVRESR
jgi:hypothetical protein